MEIKKSPKADLNSMRLTFTLVGLVVTLFIVWRAFEYKSYSKKTEEVFVSQKAAEEEELIEITKQEMPKPKVEVPKQEVAQIKVVENEEEADETPDFSSEIDEDEVIEEVVINVDSELEEEDVEEEEVFLSVEENPEFPGGTAKLLEYVQKNLKYPMMARESDIQGRVFVGFVVEKDGSISNVQVLRGIGGGCDEEAVRVVQTLPSFKPGKQRGNPVRVAYTLPIVFKLQ